MMKHRSNEEKFLLLVTGILLFVLWAYSTCGKADVVQDIRKEAVRQGVNPDIAVAVAKVESNFDQTMIGKKGEIGIFQVMPYHAKGKNLWDLKTNIRLGIRFLKQCQIACEKDMPQSWIICYNNGTHRHPKHPLLHPYYRKVMAAMQ